MENTTDQVTQLQKAGILRRLSKIGFCSQLGHAGSVARGVGTRYDNHMSFGASGTSPHVLQHFVA